MKINDKRKAYGITFGDIKQGECFYDEDGDLVMKIEEVGNGVNGVDMSTGTTYVYCDDAEVFPVNAEITVF